MPDISAPTAATAPVWCWLDDAATRACWARLGRQPPSDIPAIESRHAWLAERAEPLLLGCLDGRLSLVSRHLPQAAPLQVDFTAGAMGYRSQQNVRAELLVKAVLGRRKAVLPGVADATAGLGRDAFLLATLGCQVWLWERHPAVQLLLADGLQRAADLVACARMHLVCGAFVPEHVPQPIEVVCLDPMFPTREKSASVKKDMQLFHQLVGADADADALFAQAVALAPERIIVKRPRLAPCLAGRQPTYVLSGRASRFDVYQFSPTLPPD